MPPTSSDADAQQCDACDACDACDDAPSASANLVQSAGSDGAGAAGAAVNESAEVHASLKRQPGVGTSTKSEGERPAADTEGRRGHSRMPSWGASTPRSALAAQTAAMHQLMGFELLGKGLAHLSPHRATSFPAV